MAGRNSCLKPLSNHVGSDGIRNISVCDAFSKFIYFFYLIKIYQVVQGDLCVHYGCTSGGYVPILICGTLNVVVHSSTGMDSDPQFPQHESVPRNGRDARCILVNQSISTAHAAAHPGSATPRCCTPDTRQVYSQAPSLPVRAHPIDKIAPNGKLNVHSIRQI